jgi:dihydropteroate synthase
MPPSIMGILNATPDSFANEGVPASVEHGLAMIAAGADVLDIGGESTRPGAESVPPDEEQRRVLPLISGLARHGVPISIDTRNASTMASALDAGATMVNDVSGLTYDPAAAPLIAARGCRVVLMHSRGTPASMQQLTHYDNLIADVLAELTARIALAEEAGVERANIIIDPGLGFAKTATQSLELLRRLAEFRDLGLPILVGVSRKSFIGRICGEPNPQERMPGSLAAALFALRQGADILRVHDVAATVQALRVWGSLLQ